MFKEGDKVEIIYGASKGKRVIINYSVGSGYYSSNYDRRIRVHHSEIKLLSESKLMADNKIQNTPYAIADSYRMMKEQESKEKEEEIKESDKKEKNIEDGNS